MLNGLVGFICGVLVGLLLTIGVLDTLKSQRFTGCSVGQNFSQRTTSGIATYRVTFKEGIFDKETCIKLSK
jgi:hypothetical protein